MKKIIFALCLIIFAGCKSKDVIKLSQKVTIEHVDYLGNGKYEVYFSYKSQYGGHPIGTGIMVDRPMSAGDVKTYIEGERKNEYDWMEPYYELRD